MYIPSTKTTNYIGILKVAELKLSYWNIFFIVAEELFLWFILDIMLIYKQIFLMA